MISHRIQFKVITSLPLLFLLQAIIKRKECESKVILSVKILLNRYHKKKLLRTAITKYSLKSLLYISISVKFLFSGLNTTSFSKAGQTIFSISMFRKFLKKSCLCFMSTWKLQLQQKEGQYATWLFRLSTTNIEHKIVLTNWPK